MSQIVEITCNFLIWLGILDPKSCDASLMLGNIGGGPSQFWLKALAGPTLLLSILTVVLLEEVCLRGRPEETLEPLIQIPLKKANRRHGDTKRHNHQIQVDNMFGDTRQAPGSKFLRLMICDESKTEDVVYRISWTCHLREIVKVHMKEKYGVGHCNDCKSTVLLHNGRNLDLDQSPRHHKLFDLDKLDIVVTPNSFYSSAEHIFSKIRSLFKLVKEPCSVPEVLQREFEEPVTRPENDGPLQLCPSPKVEDNIQPDKHKEEPKNSSDDLTKVARIQRMHSNERSKRIEAEKYIQSLLEQLESSNGSAGAAKRRFEHDIAAVKAINNKLNSDMIGLEGERDKWLNIAAKFVNHQEESLSIVYEQKKKLRDKTAELNQMRSQLNAAKAEAKQALVRVQKTESQKNSLEKQLHTLQNQYQQVALRLRPQSECSPGTIVRPISPPGAVLPGAPHLSVISRQSPLRRQRKQNWSPINDEGGMSANGTRRVDWSGASFISSNLQVPLLIIDDKSITSRSHEHEQYRDLPILP
uniref:Uncharacterized protein n=1 Tax=Spongospora subterranea TaxID=70186 RepID=A0A0H5QMR3_9EUKA|eukprot:CRZ03455.1 hypothetical protein [Spongospora subterranea]